MRNRYSIIAALLALIAAGSLLAACQTTAGLGQDLSQGGQAITNSAEKAAR